MSKISIKDPFNMELLQHFRAYRNRLSISIKLSEELYFKNKINECAGDPKQLWGHIRDITGKNHKHDSFFSDHFILTQDFTNKDLEVANILNDYFVSVGEKLASAVSVEPCEVEDADHVVAAEFVLVPVTEYKQEVCINELRGGSAPGVDNIIAKAIKDNFIHVKMPLLKVVNTSIINGIFPDVFKVTKVTPLFKGGDKRQCSNYRSISLLSVVSKLLGKCIKKNSL